MQHSKTRITVRSRPAAALAVVLAASIALTGCAPWNQQVAGGRPNPAASPASEAFAPEQLETVYESDRTVDYVPLLAGFATLEASYPEVLEENLAKTLDINQNAGAEESAAAIIDEYGDMSYTMGNALGEKLGAIYQRAWEEGRLPKTVELIHKDGGRAQSESTNPSKDYFDYDRPYIVAPDEVVYRDKDGGDAYSSTSGSYPSGHTNQAYWQGTLLATLLPELSAQILARTSESGNYRVVMAMHYPLDIIGGRMMGQAAIAKRWADPEFRELLEAASAELHAVLEADCGAALKTCIARDTPYLKTKDANELYRDRLTYGFEQIGQGGVEMDAPRVAAALLISSHPRLTEAQRIQVLEETAIDSGYPLDLSVHSTSSWQRIDLAAAMTAKVSVDGKGRVHVSSGKG
ncbi:hypothetical protein M2317_003051 [Microbacterium sp. ZKA21]|uniref:acid phosphatase n=1 Tax=Microbacterium sp. ZKA21 TaxID=3381694 RepID=UPI003D21DEC2